jgi:hypothetical protein
MIAFLKFLSSDQIIFILSFNLFTGTSIAGLPGAGTLLTRYVSSTSLKLFRKIFSSLLFIVFNLHISFLNSLSKFLSHFFIHLHKRLSAAFNSTSFANAILDVSICFVFSSSVNILRHLVVGYFDKNEKYHDDHFTKKSLMISSVAFVLLIFGNANL